MGGLGHSFYSMQSILWSGIPNGKKCANFRCDFSFCSEFPKTQSLYRVLCAKLLLFYFLAVILGNNRLTWFQCGLRMRLLPKRQLKKFMRHPITVQLAFQAFRE